MSRFAGVIQVVVQVEPSGGYWGEVPALPGCYSQGETVDDLLANSREAIADLLKETREEGCLPEPDPPLAELAVW